MRRVVWLTDSTGASLNGPSHEQQKFSLNFLTIRFSRHRVTPTQSHDIFTPHLQQVYFYGSLYLSSSGVALHNQWGPFPLDGALLFPCRPPVGGLWMVYAGSAGRKCSSE